MHNTLLYFFNLLYKYWYITFCIILLISAFLIAILYKLTLRITTIHQLPKNYKNTRIHGYVSSVSDGDGFRLFHTPFLRRKVYRKGDQTIQIRLAMIDAPEVRKFSRPAQPFSKESKEYLAKLINKKNVIVKMLAIDVYNRVIASVYVHEGSKVINISLEMVRVGLACVYVGKVVAYDDYKEMLEKYERNARNMKLGMWNQDGYVSPMDYKRNIKV